MQYVYILQSEKDREFYVGETSDLQRRLQEHKFGKVESTKYRRPLRLLCYEAYRTRAEAMRREKYLKSSDGKKDIRKRIKESMLTKEVLVAE